MFVLKLFYDSGLRKVFCLRFENIFENIIDEHQPCCVKLYLE